VLDKLGMIDESSETPNKIIEMQKKLNDFELLLIEENSSRSIIEQEKKTKVSTIDNKILKVENQISKVLKDIQQDSLGFFILLHQGVLISKNKNVKEIVYDIHRSKLFDSEKELLRVARLTPNLPNLTTDSELYCHIINLKPDDLEKNPFIISMEAELSEPVEVESPSNIRALQEVNTGIPTELFSDGEADTRDSIDILKALQDLDKISSKLSDSILIKGPEIVLLKGYIGKLTEPDQSDLMSKFKPFIDPDITLKNSDIGKLNQLVEQLKRKIKMILLDDLKKYLPKSNYTTVAHSEYILKYPIPFEAKRKPTIKLLAKQFTVENYADKFVKGKSEGPTYDIKYEQVTLIEDELPPVHRLFRFSVNAGVLLTNSISYNYEQVPLANSNVIDLKEVKETSLDFRPSITFSTYLWKQDLAVNVPINRFYETTHIDVSIDYDDSKILDNIYLGVGIEPLRNIQLAVGARFGQVDRLKPENFDPLMDLSGQKFSSEIDVGYYVSLSLGFDLIPKFYNLIVNK
jgi:hypothetical protein